MVLVFVSTAAAIANYYVARPVANIQKEIQETEAAINTGFYDAMHGHKEIKSYDLCHILTRKFSADAGSHKAKVFAFAHIDCLWGAIEISVSILIQIGIAFLCLYYVLNHGKRI